MITLPDIKTFSHGHRQLESLYFYLKLVRLLVKKIAPKIQNGLCSKILRDEDAVSYIAFYVMRNEVNFDSEKSSLNTYRCLCVRWGIQKYLEHISQSKPVLQYEPAIQSTEDTDGTPYCHLARQETIELVRREIESDYWNDKERVVIKDILMLQRPQYLVANELGMGTRNLKLLVENIKERLKERLSECQLNEI